jgi:hypothetical protein
MLSPARVAGAFYTVAGTAPPPQPVKPIQVANRVPGLLRATAVLRWPPQAVARRSGAASQPLECLVAGPRYTI